ncbi:LysR family transcriptional regulator [Seohaeicola zhoushanensis]
MKQLRYVEAAGRLGSIARAAEEMAISQSSITAAIDALEHSLDYDLFVRTPAKGIHATPPGLEALQMIRGFLNHSRHFEADLQSVGGDETGVVRIGCYGTAAPAFLPEILRAMKDRRPNITVDVLEGDMSSVVDFLRDGKADLSFTYEMGLDSGQQFEPLFNAPPYALISTDDPMSELPGVTYAQLSRKTMVMLDLPYARDYFSTLFSRRGLSPTVGHATRSADFARALVAGIRLYHPQHPPAGVRRRQERLSRAAHPGRDRSPDLRDRDHAPDPATPHGTGIYPDLHRTARCRCLRPAHRIGSAG